ncbi:MAG: hypothetical protein ACKV2Q_29350 [Planctomycetaceae bacterium]
MSASDVAPQLRHALEGSVAALRRLADSELPTGVANRMNQLGERKEFLNAAEQAEYADLVSFWMSRTLEKAEATVALQRLREAVPDLMTSM